MSIQAMHTSKHTCVVCGDVVDIRVKTPVAKRYYCASCWGILAGLKHAVIVTSTMTSVKLKKIVKKLRRKKLDEIRHQTV